MRGKRTESHCHYPGASFTGDHPTTAMVLLTVAVGCNGFIYSGEQSAMLDIANNFAGTLMGVINALGIIDNGICLIFYYC